MLEGVVTNVAAFGAFVDIGVHQDGLVHISALADTFVKDPHTVVKAGQVVKVKVLEVDEKRKRIALTMRLDDRPHGRRTGAARGGAAAEAARAAGRARWWWCWRTWRAATRPASCGGGCARRECGRRQAPGSWRQAGSWGKAGSARTGGDVGWSGVKRRAGGAFARAQAAKQQK